MPNTKLKYQLHGSITLTSDSMRPRLKASVSELWTATLIAPLLFGIGANASVCNAAARIVRAQVESFIVKLRRVKVWKYFRKARPIGCKLGRKMKMTKSGYLLSLSGPLCHFPALFSSSHRREIPAGSSRPASAAARGVSTMCRRAATTPSASAW